MIRPPIRQFARSAAVLATLAATIAPSLFPSGTTAWEMTSYADFIRGRFDGVSLSREGRLSLAPKVETVFSSDQPMIWSVAQASDGTLYAGTGHRGRVYRIDRAGKSSLLWTSDQPEVFAIAVDRNGVVYAGTSPDGKVYRIENGQATEYFTPPKARYIWSLAVAPDGALYVGTGDQGKIYRVESAGHGELYYETGQSHITGLAIDSQGRLLAGSEPNGILYRITAKDKAFVLYDASLPEIRAIVPMPDGTVYAAALGGSIAKRAQSAAQAAQGQSGSGVSTATTTTITVEAQAGPGNEIKPPDPKQTQSSGTTATPQVSTQFTPVVDVSSVEKSALYRINPDNTVETLWSSKEENVYDVLALERQVLFSTDENGRIYGLSPDRRVTLVAQTNEGETTRLLPSDHSVLAATGNMGRIFRLGENPGSTGYFEAPPHDAGTASRWGSLSWRGETPPGCTMVFRTRSGNSAKPDRTWSEWSGPLTNPAGSPIASPNARYIQWKAELAGTNGATPILNSATLAYLPQNSPPVVKSINVVTQSAPAPQSSRTAASNSSSTFSVTVSDTGETSTSSSAGTPTQTLPRAASQQISLSWQAEDPDGDRLVYSVYFRSEDASQWMLLKSGMHDNSITFDGDILADGKYFFRVVASDREANPPPSARDAQLTSAPVMIDNTPPVVTLGSVRYSGGAAHVEFEAVDAASPLRHCEFSLDAASWVPVQSVDGVIDSLRERFALDLPGLSPGEHLLVLRVADSANNSGLAKVVLK
jgi:hypothetical protein